MDILKKEEAQAGRSMAKCRKEANKKKGQYITVEEFCKTTGLDRHDVTPRRLRQISRQVFIN